MISLSLKCCRRAVRPDLPFEKVRHLQGEVSLAGVPGYARPTAPRSLKTDYPDGDSD